MQAAESTAEWNVSGVESMRKFVLKFAKEGYIKYTSHLDMLRLFKRALKKTGVTLAYSQGFNPHPKMGFAQPLSLGYTSHCELLELETSRDFEAADIQERIAVVMPEGITVLSVNVLDADVKSLAAAVTEAQYVVTFPIAASGADYHKVLTDYLAQSEILAEKRQKKTKKMVTVDIRGKIRNIEIADAENLTLVMNLDSGSTSNLSPEQVIASFMAFAELNVNRYDVEVERKELYFEKGLKF